MGALVWPKGRKRLPRPEGPSDLEAFVAIGRIQKPRGVRGEVFLLPLTDYPERFEGLTEVLLERPDGVRVSLRVEAFRAYGKRLGIKFRGFETPEAVGRLKGSVLLVCREAVYPLPEDTFYVFEVVGLKVETEAGEAVGKVVDVLSFPANDVYVVDRDGEEVLLPAVRELIQVDLAGGRVVVRDLEGLL